MAKTARLTRVIGICEFPGCGRAARERHHVTYDPPLIVKICITHHQQISARNEHFCKAFGRRYQDGHGAISSEERLRIHEAWWVVRVQPERV